MSKHIVASVAFAALSLAGAKASAATQINSPYASAGISIGMADGRPVACIEEGGFGANQRVTTRQLGGGAGLDDNYHLVGGTGRDFVVFVLSTTSNYCRSHYVSMSPLSYNGKYFDVNAAGGNDTIIGAQGDTIYFGAGGDDSLVTYSPMGTILGGDNNDLIVSISGGGNEAFYGDNGDDCIQDSTDTYWWFTCGAGTNDRSTNSFHTHECETRGVSCCLCF